jgi:hypothetical protein
MECPPARIWKLHHSGLPCTEAFCKNGMPTCKDMEAPPFWLALRGGVLQNGMPTSKDMEAPPFWLSGGVWQNGMPTCEVIMHLLHTRQAGWKPKCPERWNQKVLKLEAFLGV